MSPRLLAPPSLLAILALACGPEGVSASGTTSTDSTATTESESESAESSDSSETSSTDDTGEDPPECAHYLRIDQCCNQPFPAAPEAIEAEADPCVVAWPVDWDALPADQQAACVDLQPEFCQLVDCDYVPPPTQVVEPDDEGACRWVCPEGEGILYASPGCGEPPPIAECLPPPPPCAQEFCSCEGETIYGCGYVGQPYAHEGPCD